jgi:thiamine thiazole synthase
MAKAVIDGTGHDATLPAYLKLKKHTIKYGFWQSSGERSLSVDEAERTTVENTKEIFPGLYVSGMAANGVSGAQNGPIFGGIAFVG